MRSFAFVAHAMPANELSALAGENADARLANSEVLTHPFVCRLGAGQEGLKRRHRRGTEDIERVLDRGPVTFSALYRGLASFVPCGSASWYSLGALASYLSRISFSRFRIGQPPVCRTHFCARRVAATVTK